MSARPRMRGGAVCGPVRIAPAGCMSDAGNNRLIHSGALRRAGRRRRATLWIAKEVRQYDTAAPLFYVCGFLRWLFAPGFVSAKLKSMHSCISKSGTEPSSSMLIH